MRCAARGASFAEYIMKAFALKPLSLFACILAMQAARNSFADTQPAEANMTISNMQLQVRALPGNTGAASVSTAGYQVLEGYVINPPTFSNYDRTTATDPDPTVLLYSDFARSSGIIESPLLNGSIYAWGIHQPGESYYAEAALSGAYYPKITPFTEVTLSGRVSAQLTGTVEDASSSFSTANISITFGRQSLWRYISLRGDVHTLDEEFSLTFTNDTNRTLDFDWYSYARVNAPIPEPSQSSMLLLGLGMLGLLRQSRLALRPNMRHSESS
jgi:hypothetical protein